MALDKDEIEKEALEILDNNLITSVVSLVSMLACSRRWFYDNKMHKLHTIKKAIKVNMLSKKEALSDKWYESDNAIKNMGWFKLNANKDEYQRLNGTKFSDKNIEQDTKPIKVVIENKTHRLDE